MAKDGSVIIVGGGIAGLAAASKLGEAGFSVIVLEARNRIGGRIFTRRERGDSSVEFGAEFIHGLPPEIWEPVQENGLGVNEVEGESWCASDEGILPCRFFREVESILEKMDDSSPDESFLDFLKRRFPNPKHDSREEEIKQRAIRYVSGFNAADPAQIGVHWLVQSTRAEVGIQGHRAFRLKGGYEGLLDIFRKRIADKDIKVHTNCVVERVSWQKGAAEVTTHSAEQTHSISFKARYLLSTLPLGLLKAPVGEEGAVQFAPQLPAGKLGALDKLEMGEVIRVTLLFRDRFWDAICPPPERDKPLSEMSFLLSQDEWFPTWWTAMPDKAPMITGWAPFRSARRLSGQNSSFVVEHALSTLGKLLGMNSSDLKDRLTGAYFHDWQKDPFARGAYSYGKVGGHGAQQALGAPVENTLFFAGEATDTTGHNGTVHGAIASGYRAAGEIVRAAG